MLLWPVIQKIDVDSCWHGHKQTLAAVRSEMDEEAFTAAWQEGRTTSLDQVIHDVLTIRS